MHVHTHADMPTFSPTSQRKSFWGLIHTHIDIHIHIHIHIHVHIHITYTYT